MIGIEEIKRKRRNSQYDIRSSRKFRGIGENKMAEYEKYIKIPSEHTPNSVRLASIRLAREIYILRKMLWLGHGHTGMYGDDGEMQCSECLCEYGFYDWKRTDIEEIEEKIYLGNLKKYNEEKLNGKK